MKTFLAFSAGISIGAFASLTAVVATIVILDDEGYDFAVEAFRKIREI